MTMLVAGSRLDNVLQLIASIVIFILVLVITYFVTRWIGSYQKAQLQNSNMQVIETMKIANNKYIQIIKIAETYMVIAVCKDSITHLTDLKKEDIEHIQMPIEQKTESFHEILQRLKILKK